MFSLGAESQNLPVPGLGTHLDCLPRAAQRRGVGQVEVDDAIWGDYDIMLTAAALGEAPSGWNAFAGAPLYMMSTVLHVPSISLPVLRGPNGLPIGLQILARRHDDRALFAWTRWAYRRLS